MNLRKYSIRQLLKFTGFLVVLSLVVFTAIFLTQQINSQHYREALLNLEHLHQLNLTLQKNKFDFLFIDMKSMQLYRFGYSKSTLQHDSLIKITNEELIKLEQQFKHVQTIDIKTLISKYDRQFQELKDLVIERGFKDNGLEGQLREKIHMVEENVKQLRDFRLMSHMLMLRRHEKDYIIRRDSTYIKKFDTEYQAAQDYATKISNGNKFETLKLLKNYSNLFHSYIEIDKRIGINETKGAQARLNELSIDLSKRIDELRTELTKKLNANSHKMYVSMLGLIFITSILLILILAKIIKHITKTIKSIQQILKRMGKGEIPEQINIRGKDEFSGIEHSVNELSTALRNTRDFAIAVGKGNFYSEVNVFNNSGELGTSLIEMRKQLMTVAEEREQNFKINEQRNWLNENLAKASELLRTKFENTTELCFQFIRFIVKATAALQGGVYLIKIDEETNEQFIELSAAYALDRRKYLNHRLDIHEGLPGACIYEKDIIYITDIPKDYTHITTGLGHSSPSCIVLAPLVTDRNEVLGCIEVASYNILSSIQVEFISKSCVSLASAIKFIEMINFNERVIIEMKQKNNELLASEEELKQNMEELKTIREDMERREEELQREIKILQNKLFSLEIENKLN